MKKKLAVVCKTLPPLVIGSTVLMNNLFSTYEGEMEAFAGWEYGARADHSFSPSYKVSYLRFPGIIQRIMDKFAFIYFPVIRFFLHHKLKHSRPGAVFAACTPDGLFFVASYQVCKKLGIPFWGHMHDLWVENTRPGSFNRKLAEHWEPVIFKSAQKIICMTNHQLEYYRKKYPRDYELIPHCVKQIENSRSSLHKTLGLKQEDKIKNILYTGNISTAMNLDALRTFVKVVTTLPKEYKITMLVSTPAEQCKALGLWHPRISYNWVSVSEAKKIQQNAHLLFLPLSFKNCSEKEVQTVFATKTLDYLTSGTPILVYSPATSFHSWSASESGWGEVVSQDDEKILLEAIIDLTNNKPRQQELIECAYNEAERRKAIHYSYIISTWLTESKE